MQPGLIVSDVDSLDFHMARKVNYGEGEHTELEIIAMELQPGGRYWHRDLWCSIKLKVRNWGKLPIHDIHVDGNFSVSSSYHNRPYEDEKPGTLSGHHDFIPPETEEIIELVFCYASFYSDRVRGADTDPLNGSTKLILDDSFIFLSGNVFFRDQFTKNDEKRALGFSWGGTYNPQFNRDKKKSKVRMRPIRTVQMSQQRT